MKVLIGTPIHELKDYSMEQWLENVRELRKVYPADLLMVDNSPTLDYIEKVKGYCKKLHIEDYEIMRLDIAQEDQVNKSVDEQIHERVARCQEIVREYILERDYDAWFAWECDQMIPPDALNKLVEIMKAGNYMLVNHNCWDKNVPGGLCFDLGVSLMSRACLKKYSFLLEFGKEPEPDTWYNAHLWYRKRLKLNNDPFIDISGVISPILHI